jgi:hypothetical protein
LYATENPQLLLTVDVLTESPGKGWYRAGKVGLASDWVGLVGLEHHLHRQVGSADRTGLSTWADWVGSIRLLDSNTTV